MRRFSDGYHSQLIELSQIENLAVAKQTRSRAPQLALHRRRDIDRSQCFVENLAGELLQIRHERFAERLLNIPAALPDSACSVAAVRRKARPHFVPPCTPSSYASRVKPMRDVAPAPHSHVLAPDG